MNAARNTQSASPTCRAVLAVAFLMVTAPAYAQAPSQAVVANRIEALTLADLTKLLTSAEMTGIPERSAGGDPVLRIRTAGGGQFMAALRSCPADETPSCPHLELYAVFSAGPANSSVDAINLFNRRAAGVKAFRLQDGTTVLSRYVTLQYGIAQGNLLGNIAGFQRSAESFRAFLTANPVSMPESRPQVAVSNTTQAQEPMIDPGYIPSNGDWAGLLNDPQTDGFVPPAPQ